MRWEWGLTRAETVGSGNSQARPPCQLGPYPSGHLQRCHGISGPWFSPPWKGLLWICGRRNAWWLCLSWRLAPDLINARFLLVHVLSSKRFWYSRHYKLSHETVLITLGRYYFTCPCCNFEHKSNGGHHCFLKLPDSFAILLKCIRNINCIVFF